ncbi:5781_t:CDS:2 [Paraglomus brasilianum]|uniref:5781_t:CDS:1 n=1 Tax=Paraglomus brasilianum TaxID=144538 RepID=A0A9N9AY27_9GLOM|nr:5781_t:CDS:2 [Paraglomus brasilianum]
MQVGIHEQLLKFLDNRHKSVRNGHAIFAWNNCAGVKVKPLSPRNFFPPQKHPP